MLKYLPSVPVQKKLVHTHQAELYQHTPLKLKKRKIWVSVWTPNHFKWVWLAQKVTEIHIKAFAVSEVWVCAAPVEHNLRDTLLNDFKVLRSVKRRQWTYKLRNIIKIYYPLIILSIKVEIYNKLLPKTVTPEWLSPLTCRNKAERF